MRILVVEDDPLIAMAAEQTLIGAGHVVLGPFSTPDTAFHGAVDANADVALVDINLAGHNEGLEVARNFRDNLGLRTLFASGQLEMARANKDVAIGILQKPYSDAALRDAMPVLEALLNGATPPPPSIPSGLEIF